MSSDTPPPKRVFLSLRSIGVMCVVLALFAVANLTCYGESEEYVQRGVPLPYGARIIVDLPVHVELDPRSITMHHEGWRTYPEPEGRDGNPAGGTFERFRSFHARNLAIDVIVALLVSFALASERFVFSKLHHARDS